MTAQRIAALAGLLGAAGVGLGAFGAHGLAKRVPAADLAIFETATRYHLTHAVALLALAAWAAHAPSARLEWAAWAFTAGIAIFSGSLYLLVLTNTRWLGAITPIGGVALIAGWLLIAAHALASARQT